MDQDPAPLFPLFADLRGRRVLVVGGGAVARRKLEPLLAAGARVVVAAPWLEPSVMALFAEGRIEHLAGRFEPEWLEGAWLVVAATDDAEVNRAVAQAAQVGEQGEQRGGVLVHALTLGRRRGRRK